MKVINKAEIWFFKAWSRKTQITDARNFKDCIITDPTDIKRIVKNIKTHIKKTKQVK